MKAVYLDNNATTAMDARVQQAMLDAYRSGYANPASTHRLGQIARRRLDDLRERILQVLGGRTTGPHPDRLIFTSGGTESNNFVLHGMTQPVRGAHSPRTAPRIVVSAIEHPSVAERAEHMANNGCRIDWVDVDSEGVISLEHLSGLLDEPANLVSIMAVNHETGSVQPVSEAAEICRERGVPLHTDAIQAVGKIPFSFAESGASAMSVTAHKIHGPRGIGALLTKGDLELQPLLFGGSQQLGARPGTEDVALATGMSVAVELAVEELSQRMVALRARQSRFETGLQEQLGDAVRIQSSLVERAPHTSNVSFRGVNRQALLMAADMAGISCSTGSACASGSSEPSPVLQAMDCDPVDIEGALRFSFAPDIPEEDIDWAVGKLAHLVNRMLATGSPS